MIRYIELDALVAQIEKTINGPYPKHDQQCDWEDGYCSGLYKALSIIEDTLEVKEADLEKESELWIEENQDTAGFFNLPDYTKHIFALGLKAQKGE